MRFVVDTHLLVSGVIAAGLPRRLVDAAKTREFELCTSEVPLTELLNVRSRSRFAARLPQAGFTPQGIVDDLRLIASGDKRDLLPLGTFQGIPIVTAREAVERLQAMGTA